MKKVILISLLAGLAILSGCATGAARFQSVDQSADLDAATLARYKAEAGAAGGGQGADCCGQLIEKTDNRLLGILLYWHAGEVHASSSGYMVSETHGWGPLSGLLVSETMSNYAADGRRLNTMNSSAIIWGQVIMYHKMQDLINGKTWHSHWMLHGPHHSFGLSEMDGKTAFSLFSIPNPIQVGED